MTMSDTTREQMRALAVQYPRARSAVMPMLHLAQSEDGEVTAEAMATIADILGISAAEVTAVASFYTMYKRRPVGEHHIGVCVNTLCGLLGGDAVYEAVSERLGVGNNQPTADGKFWLERIECQAACTYAPVMTVDWEFMDDVTVSSAVDVIDRLAAGQPVDSTRGPRIRNFAETERTLALIDTSLAGEGECVDAKMLAGLRIAKERGMQAPRAGEG